MVVNTKQKIFKVAHKARTQVWEVKCFNEDERSYIKFLDKCGDLQNYRDIDKWRYQFTSSLCALNIWSQETNTMDVMVEAQQAARVAGFLHERGIGYAIAISDVLSLLRAQHEIVKPTPSKNKKKSTSVQKYTNKKVSQEETKMKSASPQPAEEEVEMDESPMPMSWSRFHDLNTIYAFLHKLANNYPSICSVHVIGRSVEGRDLLMLKISNGNPNNEGVWLDGAIHPREWISVSVVTFIIDSLVRSFTTFKKCITSKDWFILPVMNPDGYDYTFTVDRMWRKNRAKYGQCVGVDLNRNFSVGWGEQGEEGSSEDPGSVFYRGPSPFSEPETLCIKHQILDSTTKFKVFLSFHSYGEVIIFPWGYSADPCPDYVELLEAGTAFARGIYETSGKTYRVGSTKDLMYFASGTSIDWSYGVAGIPFCFMVELRSKKSRFLLPKEEILPTSEEIFNGLLRFMEFVDKSPLTGSSCVSSKL